MRDPINAALIRGMVLAQLHAVTIRDSGSFTNVWGQFGDTGAMREPEDACNAMRAMLSRSKWWASALRDARRAAPYAGSAA